MKARDDCNVGQVWESVTWKKSRMHGAQKGRGQDRRYGAARLGSGEDPSPKCVAGGQGWPKKMGTWRRSLWCWIANELGTVGRGEGAIDR